MNKNKKIIIVVSAVVIIAIICVVAFFMIKDNGKTGETDSNDSKLSQIYEKMNEKLVYTFTATLNDKNSKIMPFCGKWFPTYPSGPCSPGAWTPVSSPPSAQKRCRRGYGRSDAYKSQYSRSF